MTPELGNGLSGSLSPAMLDGEQKRRPEMNFDN